MKKLMAMVLVVLFTLGLSVNAFAYTDPYNYNYGYNYGYGNNYGYDNYGYNYGYGNGYNNYGSYGYYNCTGMRQNWSDEEYTPAPWFDTYVEEYGVVFHLYPTMPVSRSDVFVSIGKAMNRAYEDSNRNFSTSYGVPFRDFTWDPDLATIAGGLYQRGIMSGYSEDNTIRFVNTISRAELAKVLVTTAKQNGIYSIYNNINSTFGDIEDSWAKQYIEECAAMGLMYGKSATVFAPLDLVTYEEFVAIMLRMAERTNGGYSFDVEDIAFGISDSMDIDFEEVEIVDDDFTLAAYGSKTIYMEVGETETIKVKASPADVELKKSDVDWKVNKSGYLKLGNDYVEDDRYVEIDVKALKEGKVVLTAVAKNDNDEEVDFTIVISEEDDYEEEEEEKDVYVTSIVLNPTSVELEIGETKSINATVKPSNATDKNIVWKSHNTTVATVNQDGDITAIGVGNTTVTATANDGSGVIATIDVIVKAEEIIPTPPPVVNDKIAPIVEITGADNVAVGEKVTLTVTVKEENLAKFEILEKDLLGLTGGASINKIKKVSDNTYEITLMGVEVSSLALCINSGVAIDTAGNVSSESNEVIVFVNSGEE